MIAAVLYGGGAQAGFAQHSMLMIGSEMAEMSANARRARLMHAAELEEISTDFDTVAAPMVVAIAEEQHRLTGTAEAQYAELRALLRAYFVEESGLTLQSVPVMPSGDRSPARDR